MQKIEIKKELWKKYEMLKKIFLLLFLFSALLVSGCTKPEYNEPAGPRPIAGNPNAKVLVEEFGDFQCPACGAAYPLAKQVKIEYGNDIAFVFKHFPLRQIHVNAQKAAEASECANDQGKFWEMHDKLFENQSQLDRQSISRYAESIGLDMKKFNACLDSGAKAGIVQKEYQEGISRGVKGTPTFFVNKKVVPNWTQLNSAIQAALAEN